MSRIAYLGLIRRHKDLVVVELLESLQHGDDRVTVHVKLGLGLRVRRLHVYVFGWQGLCHPS